MPMLPPSLRRLTLKMVVGIGLIVGGASLMMWGGNFTAAPNLPAVRVLKVTTQQSPHVAAWTPYAMIAAGVVLLIAGSRKQAD